MSAFCSNCGAEIDPRAGYCYKCDIMTRRSPAFKKDPGVAALISLIIPGVARYTVGKSAGG